VGQEQLYVPLCVSAGAALQEAGITDPLLLSLKEYSVKESSALCGLSKLKSPKKLKIIKPKIDNRIKEKRPFKLSLCLIAILCNFFFHDFIFLIFNFINVYFFLFLIIPSYL
jgi:hypothetical protein